MTKKNKTGRRSKSKSKETDNDMDKFSSNSNELVLNIQKTVEITHVCLTTAAPVIFNWRYI